MELSKQLDSIVEGLISEIQNRVGDQISTLVSTQVADQLNAYDFSAVISAIAASRLDQMISQLEFDQTAIQKKINAAVAAITETVKKQADQEIAGLVARHVGQIDFNRRFTDSMSSVIADHLKEFAFPENSIPAKSLQRTDLEISGDHIQGGIIRNFGSTGIDDKATGCVVTIMDSAVVVENNLVTLDLSVQGNLEVNGTVSESSKFYQQLTGAVTGSVMNNLNEDLFSRFSNTIFKRITNDGLDLTKITINGESVIEGSSIGLNITESNLQKLGLLRELYVEGEASINSSFYVGNRRVGVNTNEPSAALAVWDEDIEVTVSKFKENTARIGTPRSQTLVLGSNRNNNIVLNENGSTEIDKLRIGANQFGSSETPPNFTSEKGHIVFNANPSVGGPLGWVCIGGANWANFGIID